MADEVGMSTATCSNAALRANTDSTSAAGMWIFGYGSLMWKVEFPYVTSVVGYVKGYQRRFWQKSEDHRGRPGRPGRVVTLVPSQNPDDCVWGVAYEVAKEHVEQVQAYLDYREKDGYDKVSVMFYPADTTAREPFELTIYVGHTDNPFFVGPDTLENMASQIYQAEGPSGRNTEYLFCLADAMRLLAPHIHDKHLFDLEAAVKKLAQEKARQEA